MLGLLLKLIGPLVILAAALLRLGLDNRWRDRRTLRRRIVLRVLVGVMFVGTVLTEIGLIHDHIAEQRERESATSQADERALKAQEERQQLSESMAELVTLARQRDPSLTEQQALSEISAEFRSLRQQTAQLKSELGGLKRYSSVSKLNAQGLTGIAGAGLKESSALSRALEGAYVEREGKLYPRCDVEGIAQFAKVAREHPSFPFAHYALAVCQRRADNSGWRCHASRAVEILNHTTELDGHHSHQDQIHQELQRLLKEGK